MIRSEEPITQFDFADGSLPYWWQSGGPNYDVELGRRDGRQSTKASVDHHLPLANFSYKNLEDMFASHGLSQVDLIALSGILLLCQ